MMNTVSLRRYRVPEGLDYLLEEIIKAVLKEQPENLELFIADYFRILIDKRNEGKYCIIKIAYYQIKMNYTVNNPVYENHIHTWRPVYAYT